MINKSFQITHSTYLKLFKFIFFLRYVFLIFFIALAIFITVPKFFNYEKKQQIFKQHLIKNYNINLKTYKEIQFKIFPLPNITISKANLKIKDEQIFLNSENIVLFLNLKNIYNYKNFNTKKILLNNTRLSIEFEKIGKILKYLTNLKKKLDVKKLDLVLKNNESQVITLSDINFFNHGYKKNNINGKIFNKNFSLKLDSNYKNINFKILNTGINAKIILDDIKKTNTIIGSSKINILNNYLKLNFSFNEGVINFSNSSLKNKDILLNFDSLIKFLPFFEFNSNIQVKKFNKDSLKRLSLEKIIKNTEIIKKLNSKNKIKYQKKIARNSLIQIKSLDLDLANGGVVLLSKIYISGGLMNCNAQGLLIEEYPRINFTCNIVIDNKKKFFKSFDISKKLNGDTVYLSIVGSLNLLNQKVNLEKIYSKNIYTANEEDLIYFKETFERILFDDGFFNIFDTKKIKLFILEVI